MISNAELDTIFAAELVENYFTLYFIQPTENVFQS